MTTAKKPRVALCRNDPELRESDGSIPVCVIQVHDIKDLQLLTPREARELGSALATAAFNAGEAARRERGEDKIVVIDRLGQKFVRRAGHEAALDETSVGARRFPVKCAACATEIKKGAVAWKERRAESQNWSERPLGSDERLCGRCVDASSAVATAMSIAQTALDMAGTAEQ